MTSCSRLCKNRSGVINSFHTFKVTRITTVAITGFNNGSTITKNLRITEQPSISAASSNSFGMVDSTNSLNRKIPCGTLIATSTRMTAHAVFISPILFTILNRLTIFIWNGTPRPARNSRKMRFPHLDFVLASA